MARKFIRPSLRTQGYYEYDDPFEEHFGKVRGRRAFLRVVVVLLLLLLLLAAIALLIYGICRFRNREQPPAVTTPPAYTTASPPSTTPGVPDVPEDDFAIAIGGNAQETPFVFADIWPGDSETRTVTIAAKHSKAAKLVLTSAFHAPEDLKNWKLTEVIMASVKLSGSDEELYNGLLSNMYLGIELPENEDGLSMHTYEITVSIPTTATSEYAGLSIKMDLIWALEPLE